MGNSKSKRKVKEAEEVAKDKYAGCTSLDQIPLIDQTLERKLMVLRNELNTFDQKDVKYVESFIESYSSAFTIEEFCGLIRMKNVSLYNRFTALNKTLLYKPSNYMRALDEALACGVREIIRLLLIEISTHIIIYTGSQLVILMRRLVDLKLEDFLIYVAQVMRCKNMYICFFDYRQLLEYLFEKRISEQTIAKFVACELDVQTDELAYGINNLYYRLACDYRYEESAISLVDSLNRKKTAFCDKNILYMACKNRLSKLAWHICKTRTLGRENMMVDSVQAMIENDMLDVFKHIITVYYRNSGKFIPEDHDSDTGLFLTSAINKMRTEFVRILLENVVYSTAFLLTIKQANIEIQALIDEKIPSEIKPETCIEPSSFVISRQNIDTSLEPSVSRQNINTSIDLTSRVGLNDNYQMSEMSEMKHDG